MDEVDDAIAVAWERVKSLIADQPAELRKRLARIKKASLNKTPRARCLAVRANDLRIERTVVEAGAKHERHEVWLYGDEVRELCAPVEIMPPGETVEEVAQRLGVTRMGMLWSRLKGEFHTHHVAGLGGRRGRPVPLIYRARPLDPNAQRFALSDPIWGWLGRDNHLRMPEDFVQTVVRVPCFWPAGSRYAEDVLDVGEGRGGRRGRNAPRRLPPPEPDHVSYKWKGEQYVGYDWREAERNPLIRENYERHQRKLALIRAARARRVQERRPTSRAGGSLLFRGWRWLCPVCQRPVKVLFYPLPPVSKLHCDLTYYGAGMPEWFVAEALSSLEAQRATPRQFACNLCNRVGRFSRVSDNMWNEVVAHLSRGLLYGHEVERPACVTAERKVAFVTHPRAIDPASVRRRQQVLKRLMQGWSYRQIAAELGVSFNAVHWHVKTLFARHGVSGRAALARKLGAPIEPLMSKRARVRAGLAAGQSAAQIARELGIGRKMVSAYAWQFRRERSGGTSRRARLKRSTCSVPAAV